MLVERTRSTAASAVAWTHVCLPLQNGHSAASVARPQSVVRVHQRGAQRRDTPQILSQRCLPLGYCEEHRRMGGPRDGDVRSYLIRVLSRLHCGVLFERGPGSRADFMSSAMSALEIAKLAGSTGAASGGSVRRRRSQSRNSCRSRRNAAFKPDRKNRSRCAGLSRTQPAIVRSNRSCRIARPFSSANEIPNMLRRGGVHNGDVNGSDVA